MIRWYDVRNYLSEITSQVLHSFGILWLFVQLGVFFIEEEDVGVIRQLWWLFVIVGVAIAVYRLRPQRTFSFKVTNRDVNVELVIGDLFKQRGPIIVGSNTRFVTSQDVISPKSVQGSFTERYFSGVDSINDQVRRQVPLGEHPFGTTVSVQAKDRVGYFCAIARMNASGTAASSVEELRMALAGLWSYLSHNAEKGAFNVPILGSGFSRVGLRREDLLKEIVRSFMAAISESAFCDVLRIVVWPGDVKEHSIDVTEMARFVDYSCRYAMGERRPTEGGSAESG